MSLCIASYFISVIYVMVRLTFYSSVSCCRFYSFSIAIMLMDPTFVTQSNGSVSFILVYSAVHLN